MHQVIDLANISKRYGSTCANENVSFGIARGEIVGLVGANGAGKSTLIQIINGLVAADTGHITVAGNEMDTQRYTRAQAKENGIRTVFQELSLCGSLDVADNFFIELSGLAPSRGWRSFMRTMAQETLKSIFPSADIRLGDEISTLSLAHKQMVEIARALSDETARLVILDEPTSSLDAKHSAELMAFVTKRASEGVAFIIVSHKLREIVENTHRVVVMRNGAVVWNDSTAKTSVPDLVVRLGGGTGGNAAAGRAASTSPGAQRIIIEAKSSLNQTDAPVELRAGEIIGISGLDGNGQRELLHRLHRSGRGYQSGLKRDGRASFVTGDRSTEGVFGGASIVWNAMATRVAELGLGRIVDSRKLRADVAPVLERLGISGERLDERITNFSGGNQQKGLMARSLLAEAETILLDDPTRGVDIGAKQQIYQHIRQAAEAGRLVVWYTSEDNELLECDRVLVMHDGAIVDDLDTSRISAEAVIETAFRAQSDQSGRAAKSEANAGSRLADLLPYISMVGVFAIIAALNPAVLSPFGMDILLAGAVPLVLAALSQVFIVSGAQIDLGLGSFVSLISMVAAVLFIGSPATGLLVLAGCLLAYIAVGVLVQVRNMPALVVTLGASFVWIGLARTIQDVSGFGQTPQWLTQTFSFRLFGIPGPITWIVIATLIAFLINRSKLGVVMRGFGDNSVAMRFSGWSALRIQSLRYGIAALFGIAAGIAMTASNGGADVNAGSTLTLLSIAAVVVGGCALTGGQAFVVGTVAGALTLALIGTLLGSLGVSSVFSASVQGALLIGVLLLRTLVGARR